MKTYGIFLKLTLLSLAAALTLSFFATRLFTSPYAVSAGNQIIELPTIILDAGHGGEDGGTGGEGGILEKDLNLSVTSMLAALFRMAGFSVVETRTDDRLLCEADTPKGHRKQADLKNRLMIAEQHPNSVLISIHMNSYPGADCRGLQVWYAKNSTAAADYAAAVQSGVKSLLQPENNRKIKASTSGIYLLNRATMPAILIECGFLSTAEECVLLANEDYQQRLAFAIFTSLSQKIEENYCAKQEVMI